VAASANEAISGNVASGRASAGGVAPFRNADIPDDSVGRALGVGVIVRGSIKEEGDRLRVTVKLVEGESGTDIRRESFGGFIRAYEHCY
jgi:TolB-like protein